jgi:hypothetical protein
MMEPLFVYRRMICRITGLHQCDYQGRPEGFLYDLTPIGGGLEIPAVRYAEFDPLPDNVSIFPGRHLPASVPSVSPRLAASRMPGETHHSPGALSNYGDV